MYANRLILFLTITAYLTSPLFINWYAAEQTSWYPPFFAWGSLIFISYWMMRSRDLND